MARKQLMVLSHTKRQRLTCAHRYGLHYVDGLRPKRRDPKLSVGSMYHKGLNAMLAGMLTREQSRIVGVGPEPPLLFDAIAAFDDYKARLPHEDQDELQKAWSLCLDMVTRYADATKKRVAGGEEVLIGSEIGFRVPILDARGRPNGLEDTGSIDALWWSTASQCFVVEEGKTTVEDVYERKKELEVGTQGVGYMHAVMRKLEAKDAGFRELCAAAGWNGVIEPGRIRMAVVRKHKPSIPKINQDGTVSTKQISTRHAIYFKALQDNQKEMSLKQLGILEGLKVPDRWYAEHTRAVTDFDIERWRKEAWAHSRTIALLARHGDYPRNDGYCSHSNLPCEYRPICVDDIPELRAELYDVFKESAEKRP